jgi:hypothetical protein
VASGLNKRPPTEHLAKLTGITDEDTAGYLIDRGEGYRFVVTVSNGVLKVFDLDTRHVQDRQLPRGQDVPVLRR